MAIGYEVNVRACKHPRYSFVASYRDGGRLRRKYFKRRRDANKFKREREAEALEHGTGTDFSGAERAAVAETRDRIRATGYTLRQIIEMGTERAEMLANSATVEELRELILWAKRRTSEHNLRNLRSRLGRFQADFGADRAADSIEPGEIDLWLAALEVGDQTAIHYRAAAMAMFNYGRKKGKCQSNPAQLSDRPPTPKRNPGILSPEEASRLLAGAEPEIVPTIALAVFAGVRPSEIERMQWRDLKFSQGQIYVNGDGKTGERLVDMRPNLKRWLKPYALRASKSPAAPVLPKGSRRMLEAARTAAGFPPGQWPQNSPRHSFGSYLLALTEDAPKVAMQLGHWHDTRTLFKHYRALVTRGQAEGFWAVAPEAETIIRMKA